MTKEELAEKLDGSEYPLELSPAEEAAAKESGLLIVYGYSDDVVSYDGAWVDEGGFDEMIDAAGRIPTWEEVNEDEDEAEKYFKRKAKGRAIEAFYCKAENPDGWSFKTAIPHATFKIIEDGSVYCIGMVIDTTDLA